MACEAQMKKLYSYKRWLLKKTILNNRIWFLLTCKRLKIFPVFITQELQNVPMCSNYSRFLKLCKVALIDEIKKAYSHLHETHQFLYQLNLEVANNIHPIIWDHYFNLFNSHAFEVSVKTKIQLKRKLNVLLHSKPYTRLNTLPHTNSTPTTHTNNQTHLPSYSNNTPLASPSAPPCKPNLPFFHPSLLNSPITKPSFEFHKRFCNFSNQSFDVTESKFLNVALKYAPPHNVNEREADLFLSQSLSLFQRFPHLGSDPDFKYRLKKITKSVFETKSNGFNYKIFIALKKKVSDSNLTLTKADKGNCLVILNKSDYTEMTVNFLNSPDFKTLKSNPNNIMVRKLKSVLKSAADTFENLSYLIPSNPSIPKLYSLPKIHKINPTMLTTINPINIPVRPVVSYIGSPTYKLQKWLNTWLIDNMQFNNQFSIKNSSSLVEALSGVNVTQNHIIFSLDVKNLFPSVPGKEVIPLLNELLVNSDASDTQVECIMSFLNLCLEQNYFRFNDTIYSQLSGLAMGSPLSPLLAEVYLAAFEQHLFASNDQLIEKVVFWRRYVDDVIVIFDGSQDSALDLLHVVNGHNPHLQFTIEHSVNNKIPFLDLEITLSNAKITYNIYRKPTTTDISVPFHSNHPMSHKFANFHFLLHRLISIPLSNVDFLEELNTIRFIAMQNDFPLDMFNKFCSNFFNKFKFPKRHLLRDAANTTPQYVSFDYLNYNCTHLTKLLAGHDITISFAVPKTINSLKNNKDKSHPLSKSGIYALSCSGCQGKYIGKTSRSFRTRFGEHDRAVYNLTPERSTFAQHILETSHFYDVDSGFNPIYSSHRSHLLTHLENVVLTKVEHQNGNLLNTQVECYNKSYIINLLQTPPYNN
jgi:hypothetical protein